MSYTSRNLIRSFWTVDYVNPGYPCPYRQWFLSYDDAVDFYIDQPHSDPPVLRRISPAYAASHGLLAPCYIEFDRIPWDWEKILNDCSSKF